MDIGDSKQYIWPTKGISIDFLATNPNAPPPPAQDSNVPVINPNPPLNTPPTISTPTVERTQITSGQTEWELFKLINSNQEIHMGDAVFKVTTSIYPNPFKMVKRDIRNFKCPTL